MNRRIARSQWIRDGCTFGTFVLPNDSQDFAPLISRLSTEGGSQQ